ncbi:Ig-like domain-containing protein [Terrisporobacter hibernicus]|uniref:Ig-like domain-containing protein n=1 Tax=Terrisporobacter hibernicus TaxID=2813371 RepID=A0AAX2ZGB5_9FIRM|nr:Ig-like domain-containing protein [Terrisporobacter hibernicus]UEL48389.1 Ig-like domain-containing protein [Terrisporobacter hibernicus]
MKKVDKDKKIIFIVVLLPLLFFVQYYLFKSGEIPPMIKGVNIKIIEGEYIQDIDKYVVKLGDNVVLSAGDYIKIPGYAKDPNIKFTILDNTKTIKLKNNSNKEKNTVILKALKTGYTSVAIMQNSRVLQKATIRVVDPSIEDLNVSVDGTLKYVGDEAEISSSVEVDYKEFNNSYNVTYESSNENVLKVINNKIKAVGVGKATVYAKSKDKVEARRYNIVARLKGIEINNSFDIAVGEAIKLKPKIITAPKNLTPPKTSYKFSQSKLPVERAVTFEDDGTIVGIRQGSEKITISCGEGENKRIEVVTINVKEGTLENSMVRNLYSKYIIEDNKLKIALSWDILNGATNYDIYIKDDIKGDSKFELYKSITQESFLKNSNIMINIELDEDIEEIAYEIYVVGRNEEGTSKPSNIESIKDTIIKDEEDADETEDEKEELPKDQT